MSPLIDPFPEDWELIGFFECEPQVALLDIPWPYNRLTFVSRRGDDHIVCEIEPGTVTFRWWHRGIEHISLQLTLVQGLSVDLAPEHDILTIFFQSGSSFTHPLRVQLRPFISLTSH